jgi:hypothetical protein
MVRHVVHSGNMEKTMADGSEDSAGLGVIVGILAVIVVLVLAIGVGPRIFGHGGSAPINVTVEQPAKIVPAPKG